MSTLLRLQLNLILRFKLLDKTLTFETKMKHFVYIRRSRERNAIYVFLLNFNTPQFVCIFFYTRVSAKAYLVSKKKQQASHTNISQEQGISIVCRQLRSNLLSDDVFTFIQALRNLLVLILTK